MTDGGQRAHRGAPMPGRGRGAPRTLPGRLRAARFDIDGGLRATQHLWAQAETELLARHGATFSPADVEATHGRSIEDSVAVYAARLGGVSAVVLRAELMALMRAHYRAGPSVRPGARVLLRALEGRLPMAVASNTDGDLVRLALAGAGLEDAFRAVVSGADVGRGKPQPDVYLAACRSLDVRPRDAVAFEDSPVGVQAAKAAGLTCVAVPERAGIDLGAWGADLVAGSLLDVVAMVHG